MRGTRGQCLQKCAKGRNFFVKKSGGGIRWSMKVGLGGVEREDSRRVKLRGWVVGGLGGGLQDSDMECEGRRGHI